MSSNRTLNAFLTSAAALGGLYLLDKFMSRGDGSRENPKRYEHIKGYEEFTEAEKQQIGDEYTLGQKSANLLAREHGCYAEIIERILREKGVTLRDKVEAARLRHTIPVTQEQINRIVRMWNPPNGERKATLAEICEATNLTRQPVLRTLKEHGIYEERWKTNEISEVDKEKLLQGKIKERNGGEKLVLSRVHKQLGLSRLPGFIVILRLFAQNGLNDPSDYGGSLDHDQQMKILSYFNPEQTLTIEQIAQDLGVSAGSVKIFLFYNNIMPRENSTFHEKPLTEEERAEVIRLYEGRMTNKQIAESTSIPRKRIAAFIKEYRESQGLKKSRRSESKRNIRLGLMTRDHLVIQKIMAARSQNPPLSFQKIADKLNQEMPKKKGFEQFSIAQRTVYRIYLEQKRNA